VVLKFQLYINSFHSSQRKTDGRTDLRSQDRASIAASCGKNARTNLSWPVVYTNEHIVHAWPETDHVRTYVRHLSLLHMLPGLPALGLDRHVGVVLTVGRLDTEALKLVAMMWPGVGAKSFSICR